MPQNRTSRNFFSSFFSWITTSFTLILNSIIGVDAIEQAPAVAAQPTNKNPSSSKPITTKEPENALSDLNNLTDMLTKKPKEAGNYILNNRDKIKELIITGKPLPLKKLIVQLESILKQDNSKEIKECVTELKLLSEKSKTLLTSSKATPFPVSQDPSQKVASEEIASSTSSNPASSEDTAEENLTLKREDFGDKKTTMFERLESLNTSLKALNDLIPEASDKKGKGKLGYSPHQVLKNRKSDIQKEIETLKTSIVEENRLIANGDSNSRLGIGHINDTLPKIDKNGEAIEKVYYSPAVPDPTPKKGGAVKKRVRFAGESL